MIVTLIDAAEWVGLGLLSAVFLANATGLIDQTRAVRELVAVHVPEPFARLAVTAGRILQLFAAPALFFDATRPFAALALAAFLIPATLTAHAFWRSGAPERSLQLANFLRNAAIIGGLILAAAWKNHP